MGIVFRNMISAFLFSVFVSSSALASANPTFNETELNQQRDFFLVKNEIIQRLGSEYRGNNFRFTSDDLDYEVKRAEYLYLKSKEENPYQYPDISQLFYKKGDLYKYIDTKIRDHQSWISYANKFMRKFDVSEYQHYLNYSEKPFPLIFQDFLNHEKLELEKWQQIAMGVHRDPSPYLLSGPYHPHSITGVDKLHAQGMNGDGTEVIVWDCGFVDNRHVNFEPNDSHVLHPRTHKDYSGNEKHGTHVSGIIAADKSSASRRGVATGASILPVDYNGIPELIERIKDSNAKIISASFHFLLDKDNVKDLDKLAEELEKNDRLLVMASGNDSKFITPDLNPNFYQYWSRGMWVGNHNSWVFNKNPILAKHMLLVGSLKEDGVTISRFSNLPGVMADHFLFAPGENIISTVAFDKFEKMSGTSMATPHVSGILALASKYYPELSSQDLKACALNACDAFWLQNPKTSGESAYRPEVYGAGRINALKVMAEAERLSAMKSAMDDDSRMLVDDV